MAHPTFPRRATVPPSLLAGETNGRINLGKLTPVPGGSHLVSPVAHAWMAFVERSRRDGGLS